MEYSVTLIVIVRYLTEYGTLHTLMSLQRSPPQARGVRLHHRITSPVACRTCNLRCRSAFRPLSSPELRFMARMKLAHLAVDADEEVMGGGQVRTGALYTLYEGWGIRYRTVSEGNRQILDFLLPGDLMGLPATLLDSSWESVRALTPITLCALDANRLPALFREHPSLALALFQGRLRDQERADTRLTLLGQLGACERLGYLLLELRDRLRLRGLFTGRSGSLPLKRIHLADAVGLSKVHLMRALRQLRERGLAEVAGRMLTIGDERKLARFSGYRVVSKHAAHPLL